MAMSKHLYRLIFALGTGKTKSVGVISHAEWLLQW